MAEAEGRSQGWKKSPRKGKQFGGQGQGHQERYSFKPKYGPFGTCPLRSVFDGGDDDAPPAFAHRKIAPVPGVGINIPSAPFARGEDGHRSRGRGSFYDRGHDNEYDRGNDRGYGRGDRMGQSQGGARGDRSDRGGRFDTGARGGRSGRGGRGGAYEASNGQRQVHNPIAPSAIEVPAIVVAKQERRMITSVSKEVKQLVLLMSDDAMAGRVEVTPEYISEMFPGVGKIMASEVEESDRAHIQSLIASGAEGEHMMNIPAAIASVFIEMFATNQPAEMVGKLDKQFTGRVILSMSLPIPIPVSCARTGDKICFGFFCTALATDAESQALVSRILSVLSRRTLMIANFKNVDKEYLKSETLNGFADKHGLVVFREDGAFDADTETYDVTLKILQCAWRDDVKSMIDSDLQALLAGACLHVCSTCQLLYSDTDNSTCIFHPHKGKQIEFEDGVMEMMDCDEDGEAVELVNYTCCGEVEKNAPGCGKGIQQKHHIRGDTFSKLLLSSEAIYKP